MGIEAKHNYRFGYLRSEQWQTVRIEALAREKGKCQFCGECSISNDAHHIHYPENVFDTKASDLVILCRPCHSLTHAIMKVHNASSHTLSQFNELAIGINLWKQDKAEWLDAEQSILPKKKTKNRRCNVCGNNEYPIEFSRPITIPGVGVKSLEIKMCSDCFDDLAEVLEKDPPTTGRTHWRTYENWKKSRESRKSRT